MKFNFAIIAVLTLLGAAPQAGAADALVKTADPIKRGYALTDFPRTKQLALGVYTFEALRSSGDGGQMTTVSLFVVGSDSVLLADGQGTVKDTESLIDAIKKVTPLPIKYVVVCSDHGDHTTGNPTIKAAYPGAVFISSPASQKTMEKAPIVPSETVADKRTVKVGVTDVEILNLGRSHTGGDLSVYVPGPKVLFMSETFFNRVFPAMRSAYPTEWLATLRKAQNLNATWYIAGHGFVDDAPTMKAEVEEFRKAVAAVIAEVKRLHDAKEPCAATPSGSPPGAPADPASCPALQKANWGPYTDWSGRAGQDRVAILKVYQELDGKLPN